MTVDSDDKDEEMPLESNSRFPLMGNGFPSRCHCERGVATSLPQPDLYGDEIKLRRAAFDDKLSSRQR